MRFLTLLLAVLVVAGVPSAARAGDPRAYQFVQPEIPPIRGPGAAQFIGQPGVAVPERQRHVRPRTDALVQQNVIVVAPVVVAPSTGCSAPGYWTYQWVPQTTTTQAWVPEHWAANATWVDAEWQTLTLDTGYWQPLWVPEGSGC